jgi:thiol-disulfide isomerase/thioredoxin
VPAWQTVALTNAVTGEQFTVADFAGKTIFVEPFATWCSNCRRQLGTVDSLRGQSGDDTVFLALSVESNIGDEALANYASQTGYGLIFAAMPPEMLQLLVEEYGQTITNPPATPHFVVGPDGTSSELFTGFRSSAEIQELFAAMGG